MTLALLLLAATAFAQSPRILAERAASDAQQVIADRCEDRRGAITGSGEETFISEAADALLLREVAPGQPYHVSAANSNWTLNKRRIAYDVEVELDDAGNVREIVRKAKGAHWIVAYHQTAVAGQTMTLPAWSTLAVGHARLGTSFRNYRRFDVQSAIVTTR